MNQTLKSLQRPETPEAFVEFFRSRHGWKCRPGSQICTDLTDFARKQTGSPHGAEDLYILFCVMNGLQPKLAGRETLSVARRESAYAYVDSDRNNGDSVDG